MIDLNFLENKNTVIISTPRSSSTYFYKCVYEAMLKKYGNKSIKLEEDPYTIHNKNASIVCKLLLPNYKKTIVDSTPDFLKKSQIIVLYPRSDYISHYTSLIIPLYSEIVLENSGKFMHWNAIPGTSDITAEFVKNDFKSLKKIDNVVAKKLINRVTQVIRDFKEEINTITKENFISYETSYDEIYNWKDNTKETLIWKNPIQKLDMFEDPSFIIAEIEKSVKSLNGWPKKALA